MGHSIAMHTAVEPLVSDPTDVRPRSDSAPSENNAEHLKRIHTFFAFLLQAQAGMTLLQRLEAQTQFIARFPLLVGATPGARAAFELRVIVDPEPARGATEPLTEVYLVGRFTSYAVAPSDLRTQARAFASDLTDTLHGSLPSFRFIPVTEGRQLTHALRPFKIADTVEFRRRPARLMDAPLAVAVPGRANE